MTINPKYKRTGKTNPFQKHEFILDTADTIFLANYFIGYFGDCIAIDGLQKADLEKRKSNYKNPFKSEDVIDKNKDFESSFIVVVNQTPTQKRTRIYETFAFNF